MRGCEREPKKERKNKKTENRKSEKIKRTFIQATQMHASLRKAKCKHTQQTHLIKQYITLTQIAPFDYRCRDRQVNNTHARWTFQCAGDLNANVSSDPNGEGKKTTDLRGTSSLLSLISPRGKRKVIITSFRVVSWLLIFTGTNLSRRSGRPPSLSILKS